MLSWRILPLPLAIALLLGMHASAQSLSGLRVGDDLSSTARLGLSPVERKSVGSVYDYEMATPRWKQAIRHGGK